MGCNCKKKKGNIGGTATSDNKKRVAQEIEKKKDNTRRSKLKAIKRLWEETKDEKNQ